MEREAIRFMLVEDVLRQWPGTADDFHRRKMICPGCVMAPFMTVDEVCRAYDIDEDALLDDLLRSILRPGQPTKDDTDAE